MSISYEKEYFRRQQPQLLEFDNYEKESWYMESINPLLTCNCRAILDVGCGAGKAMKLLKVESVFGIDLSRFAISHASRFGFALRASAEALPFKRESFDAVLMIEIVEHLDSQKICLAIEEVWRVLRKGGTLVIHTQPNGVFGKPFYFLNRKRKRETGHISTFTPWKLKRLLVHNAFKLKSLNVKDFVVLKSIEKLAVPSILRWLLGLRILAVARK